MNGLLSRKPCHRCILRLIGDKGKFSKESSHGRAPIKMIETDDTPNLKLVKLYGFFQNFGNSSKPPIVLQDFTFIYIGKGFSFVFCESGIILISCKSFTLLCLLVLDLKWANVPDDYTPSSIPVDKEIKDTLTLGGAS